MTSRVECRLAVVILSEIFHLMLFFKYIIVVVFFPCSLREELHYVLKGICHERLDVRGHALKALCKILKTNRVSLINNTAEILWRTNFFF